LVKLNDPFWRSVYEKVNFLRQIIFYWLSLLASLLYSRLSNSIYDYIDAAKSAYSLVYLTYIYGKECY
jgi:hypothetical protein